MTPITGKLHSPTYRASAAFFQGGGCANDSSCEIDAANDPSISACEAIDSHRRWAFWLAIYFGAMGVGFVCCVLFGDKWL